MNAEMIFFWMFAVCTVGSALMVVWAKSPMVSAMSLVASFFFLAGIYVLLWAHTIAVLQVLVYAGAIMVLFLFVVMLLSLDEGPPRTFPRFFQWVSGLSAMVFLGCLVWVFRKSEFLPPVLPDAKTFGTMGLLGKILYSQYLLPFEAVSLLLLVAIVGAVVVAKPRI